MMIIIPVIIAIAAAGVAAAVIAPRAPDFGVLGSAHNHAVFAVKLDGQAIDFSQDRYQVRSTGNQYIHVENGDGTTLHRHSTKVPFGEFLKSVNMDIRDGCFFRDDGRQFCEDQDKQLRFYRNSTELGSVMDYVVQENDRLLIIYGNETQEEIQAEIQALLDTVVKK